MGVSWKPQSDCFVFKAKINFSSKYRNVHKEPDLTIHDFSERFPSALTRRMVSSVLATQYDPYGFISSFLLKGKILLRKLITNDGETSYDWDDPLSSEMKNEWFSFFDQYLK